LGVTLEEQPIVQKNAWHTVEAVGLVLGVADSLHHGVLQKLVLFLRDIAVPEEEILRLRLSEPEDVLTYYRADKLSKE